MSSSPSIITTETLVYNSSSSSSSSSSSRNNNTPTVQLLRHAPPPFDPATAAPNQVLVRFLAVPINRVDLLVLGGQYPTQPTFHTDDAHAIPGFDGCGVVVQSTSSRLAAGDIVIPRELGLGTWRGQAVLPADALTKLPRDTPPLAAALLRSAALVAWFLAEEAVQQQQQQVAGGDSNKNNNSNHWVVLSAGTSTVAQFFVQFARSKGIHAALVIRDRKNGVEEEEEEEEQTRRKLLGLGASKVLTEAELLAATSDSGTGTASPAAPLLPGKVVLAVDSVFGKVGQGLAELLSPGGKFLLMGLLGGPAGSIAVTTRHLFYKQLTFAPFRSSEIIKRLGETPTEELLAKLAQLLIQGRIQVPDVHLVDWRQGQGDGPTATESLLRESIEYAKSKDVGHQKVVWLVS